MSANARLHRAVHRRVYPNCIFIFFHYNDIIGGKIYYNRSLKFLLMQEGDFVKTKNLILTLSVFAAIIFCNGTFAEEKRMSAGMVKERSAVETSIDKDLYSIIFPALSDLLWEDGYTAFKTRNEFVQLRDDIINHGGIYTYVLISNSLENMPLPDNQFACLISQWTIKKEKNSKTLKMEVIKTEKIKNFIMDKNNPDIEKLFLAITQTE